MTRAETERLTALLKRMEAALSRIEGTPELSPEDRGPDLRIVESTQGESA